MRILADQNVEVAIVAQLRRAGCDVLCSAEVLSARATDDEILEHAREGSRILLTNDKDFGELAFLQRKATSGVVLLRMPTFDSSRKAKRLLDALAVLGDRIQGSMVVVTERGIRRRPLPALER